MAEFDKYNQKQERKKLGLSHLQIDPSSYLKRGHINSKAEILLSRLVTTNHLDRVELQVDSGVGAVADPDHILTPSFGCLLLGVFRQDFREGDTAVDITFCCFCTHALKIMSSFVREFARFAKCLC